MTIDLRFVRRLVLAFSGCLLALPAWSQAALSIKPLAEKRVDRLARGRPVLADRELSVPRPRPWRPPRAWSLSVPGRRQGLAVHARRSRGGRRAGGSPGHGGRADTPRQRDRVPPAHQRGHRGARQRHAGAQPSRIGSVLRAGGQQSIRGAHGVLRHRRRQGGSRPRRRPADAGLEQRQHDLHALVMFVVDAKRPFSSPAALP